MLVPSGFDSAAPAFFSLLGVVPYLTAENLGHTLASLAGMAKSSELVLSVVPPGRGMPADEAMLAASFADGAAKLGEPWLTRWLLEDAVR